MAICLYFFPPSPKFQAYLEGYMNRYGFLCIILFVTFQTKYQILISFFNSS